MNEIDNKVAHLAIIMDGNGRWAKKRGLPRLLGHRAGVNTLERIVYAAKDRGIRYLSVYAFSNENWNRPSVEIKGLMKLFSYYARKKLRDLVKADIRVRFAGRKEGLPESVVQAMDVAETETFDCEKMTLIACFNYGGRQEIVDSVNRFVKEHPGEPISENAICSNLYLPEVPDPDLIVRTSGELRLSNFWLWQSSYSEFFFTSSLWPDFTPEALDEALKTFNKRERRYGGLK
ncbi:undecaprenyl diphosphate synthase [Dethiosulfovibrio peptidovorans DSM 11002]|uniref:Isoprenyl transferase n=1 Tax=Dethiosulfovibrio peptidovorans DSM 11002 TaxID=469381 RepID=D2Z3F3_9BACT|nr:polyprenyl diphosphate synthase [Dethiosulfovibrio peptidovorans]EFC92193.1 undecaprenyl diphosphate synthase [Dethiosulfovibrio peptidovorans DSM 11002]